MSIVQKPNEGVRLADQAGDIEGSSGEARVFRVVPRTSPGHWASVPLPSESGTPGHRFRVRVIFPDEWRLIPDPEKPRNAVRADDGSFYMVAAIIDVSDDAG